MPDSDTQSRSSAGSRAQFAHAQAKSWITALRAVGSVFLGPSDQKGWQQPWSTQAESGKAELSAPGAKPVPNVEPEGSRRKDIIEIRAEINAVENRKKEIENVNKTKSGSDFKN